jgi:2-dehydropantoate 2-reductase
VRHAILGAGGVGGFVGGALARAGRDVLLLLRPTTLAQHPRRLRVESVVLGDFEVDVGAAAALEQQVDVLWVTPKATQLEAALELAPPERVGAAVVVSLMNGVEHVAVLRERYERVIAGAIRVESERIGPGAVLQKSPFARIDLAPGAEWLADELRAAGVDVVMGQDESTVLWEKLALLAPLALTTTASAETVGAVQADQQWLARLLSCHDEAVVVALAEGATLDPLELRRVFELPLGDMRTSMQKDFDAGRPLELDAIAGPIVRGGRRHGIATPATEQLIRLVESRV